MKGLLYSALILVLFAAILNVAVAWGCSAFSAAPKFDGLTTASYRRQRFEKEERFPLLNEAGLWIDRVLSGGEHDVVVIKVDKPTKYLLHLHRAGWPFRSMEGCEYFGPKLSKSQINFQWAIPFDSDAKETQIVISSTGSVQEIKPINVLPLRPVWPGFAINTGLYAIALLALYCLWWLLRRSYRLLIGRCLRCGYDLRGNPNSGCSECGWKRVDRHENIAA